MFMTTWPVGQFADAALAFHVPALAMYESVIAEPCHVPVVIVPSPVIPV